MASITNDEDKSTFVDPENPNVTLSSSSSSSSASSNRNNSNDNHNSSGGGISDDANRVSFPTATPVSSYVVEDPSSTSYYESGEGAEKAEAAAASILRPSTIGINNRGLSMTSQKYDKNGKGYLDETEQALRRMDSQNLGYLTVDKLYDIMSTLQTEQKKSTTLMQALQRTQKEALSLKRAVYALCGFALLLALANIGTSFAAAKLAKDTTVYGNELTVKASGAEHVVVATATHYGEIVLDVAPYEKLDNVTRRLLNYETVRGMDLVENRESDEEFVNHPLTRRLQQVCTGFGSGTTCTIQGLIDYNEASAIYKRFCRNWDTDNPAASCGGGVDRVTVRCGAAPDTGVSTWEAPKGGMPFPPTATGTRVTFPQRSKSFKGTQQVTSACSQTFDVGIDCSDSTSPDADCFVFANWDPTCPGSPPVKMCGPNGFY